ncbi:MAG TPA: signal recognition particle protein, partial [Lactobacillus sp.]|nr:signal recognition particle protein [Lactobacillus sp.]
IYSMTEQERTEPDVLNPSRRRRIAAGSGRPVQEVNRMIKQFNQMKKMMNQVSKGNFSGMQGMMNNAGMGNALGGKMGQMAMKSMSRRIKKNKKRRNNLKRRRK